MKFALALVAFLAVISSAEENPALAVHRIEADVADRIQAGIANPIFGAGKSSVNVRLKLVVIRDENSDQKGGEGRSKKKLKPEPAQNKSPGGDERTQESHQTADKTTARSEISLEYSDFKIVILHDAKIPTQKLEEVRAALVAVYGPELKPANIQFHSTVFN